MPVSLTQQVGLAGVETGLWTRGPELGKSQDGCPVLEVRLGVGLAWGLLTYLNSYDADSMTKSEA